MATPQFWSTPFRYMRWASREKPAIFFSIIIGAMGPVALVTLPPIRRYLGDVDPPPIPMTYPSMNLPQLSTFDSYLFCHSFFIQGAVFYDMQNGFLQQLANTLLLLETVPPGPRQIPEGYDDE
jgi:hypothetical protein